MLMQTRVHKPFAVIILACLFSFITLFTYVHADDDDGDEQEEATEQTEAVGGGDAVEEEEVIGELPPFPDESELEQVAENAMFILKADRDTGHFIVENKQSGKLLRSYPDPDTWREEGASDAWNVHLRAPFMFRYVEFNVRRDLPKQSNFFNQQGEIAEFEVLDNGFKITYELPALGFIIPVEVLLHEDFVEATIVGDDIIDEKQMPEEGEEGEEENTGSDPMARLVSLSLFPFLGADTSDEGNGYLLLPDGPGALVEFKNNRASTSSFYSERVYGDDYSYSMRQDLSTRSPVKMPIFGIKSGENAFLGVIEEGAPYANITASPSQSLSQYNWVTAEHLFRFKFFQPTTTDQREGFFTYSRNLAGTDRTTRYYLLDGEDPGYVDMAQRYRQYLMDEQGLERRNVEEDHLALHLSLLGGGTEDGFLWDTYLSLTTTEEATEIVDELSGLGVNNMAIQYLGWQRGGFSNYGGNFPVSRKLGGNNGMEEFIEFAQSKGFSVYLDGRSYSYNSTGRDGFRRTRDGLRGLGNDIIEFRDWSGDYTFVSPRFMQNVINRDLDRAEALGVDGMVFGEAIGTYLNTDFNDRHAASRWETRDIQEGVLEETKDVLGGVHASSGNFYTLKYIEHMHELSNSYSYDMFVDQTVPFAQIALHGLVSYSFEYANMSGDYTKNFLNGIEYGAEPSFLVSYAESQELLKSRTLRQFYSTYYKDWAAEIVAQYERYNEALGDVQDQFIVDHHQLASGVFETTYEDGKRIIVNYNGRPYSEDGINVEAHDFTVVRGGK